MVVLMYVVKNTRQLTILEFNYLPGVNQYLDTMQDIAHGVKR
jgi:hypothetical protein